MTLDPILYEGRPKNSRIEKETVCYDCLDRLAILYQRVDHEHADTIEACKSIESILGCGICKNLFLTNRQMTEFYLLIMPGDKPFKTKYLSKQLGTARLSFGTPEQMEALLDLTPGSVSVLALMNDRSQRVRLLIDRELLDAQFLGFHPCINTSTLRLRTADIMDVFLPATHHTPTLVDLPWEI